MPWSAPSNFTVLPACCGRGSERMIFGMVAISLAGLDGWPGTIYLGVKISRRYLGVKTNIFLPR